MMFVFLSVDSEQFSCFNALIQLHGEAEDSIKTARYVCICNVCA